MSEPTRSMTGFASVRRSLPAGELVLSLKSVNHRGLDLRFHTSTEMDPFENGLRTLLSRKLRRGHIDVRATLQRGSASSGAGLNRPLLEAYMKAYREASAEYAVTAPPDLNAVLRTPGMLTESLEQELGDEFARQLLEAAGEAIDILSAFREREGQQLVEEIAPRVNRIAEAARKIEELRAQALPAFQTRLAERLAELLGSAGLEPQRLAQEAAILADRSDIGEEIARLKIHAAQLAEILAEGGEIGKRIDFLAQEMHREANTILSKTNGVGDAGLRITDLAIGVKSEIEKIREQSLNLE